MVVVVVVVVVVAVQGIHAIFIPGTLPLALMDLQFSAQLRSTTSTLNEGKNEPIGEVDSSQNETDRMSRLGMQC